MPEPTTVDVETSLRLIAPDATALPVRASLRYDPTDPYAVEVFFHADAVCGEATGWVFARDLLTTGLDEPAGIGDVRVWPWNSPRGEFVALALSSHDGNALFEVPRSALVRFLRRTYVQVPQGARGGPHRLGCRGRPADAAEEVAVMLSDNQRWWKRAACNDTNVDANLFHPGKGGTPEPALKVCRRCPVVAACLEDALEEEAGRAGEPCGVRGGLSAKERAPLVRARKKAVKRETASLARIRRLAAADLSYKEIGREVGLQPGSVGALCRRHNIAARRRGGPGRPRKLQPVGGGVT